MTNKKSRKIIKTKKTPRLNPALFVIGVGVVMLAVALIVLLTQGNQAPNVVQATRNPTEAAMIPYPDVPRVSLSDAKTAFDQGTAVFLDVRSTSDYTTEHVAGAISIPESQMESRLSELNPEDWIITYCT